MQRLVRTGAAPIPFYFLPDSWYMKRFSTFCLAILALVPLALAAPAGRADAFSVPSVFRNLSSHSDARALLRSLSRSSRNNNDDTSSAATRAEPTTRRTERSSSSAPARQAVAAPSGGSSFEQDILRLVNAERAKHDISPLTYNGRLDASAQDYAKHMQNTDCFSHTACGSSLKERMHDSGYYQPMSERPCRCSQKYYYGENIARGQKTAAQVMEDWMNSPSHRSAILSSKYKELGVGRSGDYWVQHFGAVL